MADVELLRYGADALTLWVWADARPSRGAMQGGPRGPLQPILLR
jgi:hypothetical protein